jgi:hypothetical protein
MDSMMTVRLDTAHTVSNFARNFSGKFSRPLTTDVELLKSKELVKPILTTRYAPVVTNGACIAAITGLATSNTTSTIILSNLDFLVSTYFFARLKMLVRFSVMAWRSGHN